MTAADHQPLSTDLFWALAEEMIAGGAADEGTMMDTRCLRVNGEFLAMVFHKTDQLIVKLPRDRVTEVIAGGHGTEFKPAGRVFKEWLAVTDRDEDQWRGMLEEGREFVA